MYWVPVLGKFFIGLMNFVRKPESHIAIVLYVL